MKTIYQSELTGKTYNSEKECLAAEAEYKKAKQAELKAKEQKANDAKEVEEAYKEYIKLLDEMQKKVDNAYNKYVVKRNEFVKKYGSYHMTIRDELPVIEFNGIEDFFESLYKVF